VTLGEEILLYMSSTVDLIIMFKSLTLMELAFFLDSNRRWADLEWN
jgi:hypothetical protein